MADLPPLPPRKTERELPPRPARELPSPQRAEMKAAKPSKPDARPMRIVYGAGAVAAVSVIAVGLIQPDFAATANQPADASVADAANANIADTSSTKDRARSNQRDPAGAQAQQPNVQVRHVVRYVHLKPGQTAPPGATVITPDAPQPRVVVANRPAPNPPAAANNPPRVVHNPPPVNKPPVAKPPAPPKPPVRSHQSGRP